MKDFGRRTLYFTKISTQDKDTREQATKRTHERRHESTHEGTHQRKTNQSTTDTLPQSHTTRTPLLTTSKVVRKAVPGRSDRADALSRTPCTAAVLVQLPSRLHLTTAHALYTPTKPMCYPRQFIATPAHRAVIVLTHIAVERKHTESSNRRI